MPHPLATNRPARHRCVPHHHAPIPRADPHPCRHPSRITGWSADHHTLTYSPSRVLGPLESKAAIRAGEGWGDGDAVDVCEAEDVVADGFWLFGAPDGV